MGETIGCCTTHKDRLLEEQLYQASRPKHKRELREAQQIIEETANESTRGHHDEDSNEPTKRHDLRESEQTIEVNINETSISHHEDENESIKCDNEDINKYSVVNELLQTQKKSSVSLIDNPSTNNTNSTNSTNNTNRRSLQQVNRQPAKIARIKSRIIIPSPKQETTEKKDNRFKTVTQQNCIQFLRKFKVICSVYVPINNYNRWNKHRRTLTHINMFENLHISCDEHKNDDEYKEMKCFVLRNFQNAFGIKKCELNDFKKWILKSIEMCGQIFLLDLNSSQIDIDFLGEIFKVLRKRHEMKRKRGRCCGPEIIDLQNIAIKDEGFELICEYLKADINDTKWLKIGHSFRYKIPKLMLQKIRNAFDRNEHILRMNIESHKITTHKKNMKSSKRRNHKARSNQYTSVSFMVDHNSRRTHKKKQYK